jgi:hypothetical protein
MMTGWFDQRILILTVCGAGQSEIKVPACLGSGEGPLAALQMAALLCPHVEQRECTQALSISSCKDTELVRRVPPS